MTAPAAMASVGADREWEAIRRDRLSRAASERADESERAGWITGSACHAREADRSRRWAAWLRGDVREACS